MTTRLDIGNILNFRQSYVHQCVKNFLSTAIQSNPSIGLFNGWFKGTTDALKTEQGNPRVVRVTVNDISTWYIEFDNEEYLAFFVLKWS